MATTEEVLQFLDAYTGSWREDRDWSKKVFHPGAGVRYPGSEDLVSPDSPPAMTDRLRAVAPDLQIRLVSWAERNDVLFAEWELTCTVRGRPLKMAAVNRFHLEGNKARAADAFIDRMALLEFADPERRPVALGELLARAVTGSHEHLVRHP